MDQKEIDQIIIAELEKGQSPDAILELAKAAEISEDQVIKSFQGFQNNPAFAQAVFLPMLNQFAIPSSVDQAEEVVPESEADYWDPLNDMPSDEDLEKRNQKIQTRFENWQASPKQLKVNFGLLIALAVFFYLPAMFVPGLREIIVRLVLDSDNMQISLLTLPAVPAVTYFFYVQKTQIDIIKKLAADRYNWKYDPSERKDRWEKASQFMPEIFNRGNNGQNIQDQFWGKYQEMDFWSGIFHYRISSGSGKNRRNTKFDTHFFCIRLPENLENRFSIMPETMSAKVFNFFKKKDLDLESQDFNKAFMVSYKEKRSEQELDIVSSLSPSVQIRLLDMKKENGSFSVLFAGNVAVFLFQGRLFKDMESDFISKGVFLDFRDRQYLDDKMAAILSIIEELTLYIK